MKLKPCPCGKTPELIILEHHSAKHWLAFGDCCNEWIVEVKIPWTAGDDESIRLANEAWNNTPRVTPDPLASKVIEAAIALEKHRGYLATRGTKEKADLFDAVIEYKKVTP